MTNVTVFLAESAEVDPDAVALRCGVQSATYFELASTAARLAECLIDGGVRPGDRVAIMLPNSPPRMWQCSMAFGTRVGSRFR
jgi:long-chain acyl-CoA synthetase